MLVLMIMHTYGVSNAPSTVGEYEYWNTFDELAEIASDWYLYYSSWIIRDPSILLTSLQMKHIIT